jgi:hypothetical protein
MDSSSCGGSDFDEHEMNRRTEDMINSKCKDLIAVLLL